MFSRSITTNLTHEQKCCECGSKQNLYICLFCKYVACNHLEHDHIFRHFVVTGHHFSLSLKDKYVYDLSLGICVNANVPTQNNDIQLVQNTGKTFTTYIPKIDINPEQARVDIIEFELKTSMANSFDFEEKSTENGLQFYEGLIHDIIEEVSPTDNYLKEPVQQSQAAQERVQEKIESPDVSEENNLTQTCLMENMKDLQLQNEEFKSAVEILTKQQQEKEKEIHQLRQDLNKQKEEKEKEIDQLHQHLKKQKEEKEIYQLHQNLNKEISRNQRLQKRLNDLERDCAEEKLINKQLKQNQIDLKHDLEIKNTEIQELKDQMRDVMFHLAGEQKLKQIDIADELEASKLIVGATLNKNRRRKQK